MCATQLFIGSEAVGSTTGANAGQLRKLIDEHKRAAKKNEKVTLPDTVAEITRVLMCDHNVSEDDVMSCGGKQELIDLYVKQLSIKQMEQLLNANLVRTRISCRYDGSTNPLLLIMSVIGHLHSRKAR